MTAASIFPYPHALGGYEGRTLSSAFESVLPPVPFDAFRSDMSDVPFGYPSAYERQQSSLGSDPPRSLSGSTGSSLMSPSPSQALPGSQSLRSRPDELALATAVATTTYNTFPSYSQPSFYASPQHGGIMPSPSQLLGGMYNSPRHIAKPRSISQRLKRVPGVYPSTGPFPSSPLSQSYSLPYRTPLPSEYTSPYPTGGYGQYPSPHQQHQSPSAMSIVPRVDYLFPPPMAVKLRPGTLNMIAAHINWSGWLRNRQPRTVIFPREVVRRILPHLEYFDLIRLNSVNKDLYHNAEVREAIQARPEDEKAACVVEAENNFKQHFPGRKGKASPGNFGCYYCFRVREWEAFEHLSWNYSSKEDGKGNDEEASENPALGDPLMGTRRGSHDTVASAATTVQKVSLPSNTASPTMTTLTRSSRQSSVASSSPMTNYFDSPHASVATSPSFSGLHGPITTGQGSLSSPGFSVEKPRTASAKKRSRPVADDREKLALRRIKLHQDKRRFCIECGVKNHFYSPGDLIEPNKIGNQKKQNNMLWVCQCYSLHSQFQNQSCRRCGNSAPYNHRIEDQNQ